MRHEHKWRADVGHPRWHSLVLFKVPQNSSRLVAKDMRAVQPPAQKSYRRISEECRRTALEKEGEEQTSSTVNTQIEKFVHKLQIEHRRARRRTSISSSPAAESCRAGENAPRKCCGDAIQVTVSGQSPPTNRGGKRKKRRCWHVSDGDARRARALPSV